MLLADLKKRIRDILKMYNVKTDMAHIFPGQEDVASAIATDLAETFPHLRLHNYEGAGNLFLIDKRIISMVKDKKIRVWVEEIKS